MSARYMLDTDSVSFALRGQGRVGARILEHRPSELCISAITLAELRYGAARRSSRKLHQLIDTFTASIAVMAFDEESAARFGVLASELAGYDAIVAAHAAALKLTLVTNNVKHFARVAGLRVENWM